MNPPSPQANPAPVRSGRASANPAIPAVSVLLHEGTKAAVDRSLKAIAGQTLLPYETLMVDESGCPETECLSGEYIQFLNTSDLLGLTKLKVQANALDTDNADIACGPWMETAIGPSRTIRDNRVFGTRPVTDARALANELIVNRSLPLQSCLFRRAFLEKHDIPVSGVFPQRDPQCLAALLLKNPRIVFTPDSLALCGCEIRGGPDAASEEFHAHLLAALLRNRPDDSILTLRFRTQLLESLAQTPSTVANSELISTLHEGIGGRPAKLLCRLNAMLRTRRRKRVSTPMTNRQIGQIEELGFVI